MKALLVKNLEFLNRYNKGAEADINIFAVEITAKGCSLLVMPNENNPRKQSVVLYAKTMEKMIESIDAEESLVDKTKNRK